MLPNSLTVPASFAHNLLVGARKVLEPLEVENLLQTAGLTQTVIERQGVRVTREQFVRLYKAVVFATDDEMLGLWSRPLRAGTFKYLGQILLDAPSAFIAMYRFSRYWSILLDDYKLEFSCNQGIVRLALVPLTQGIKPIASGHELMIKLIYGIASWLIGRRLEIIRVGFGFGRPARFSEHAELFPDAVEFDQDATFVCFDEQSLRQQFHRTKRELLEFVRRAPNDWIFVTFDHGVATSRVRAFLSGKEASDQKLLSAASALGMSDRTLSRRLALEGTGFQKIRDEIRRDRAVHALVNTSDSIDAIATAVGFENTQAFYRAFHAWTGGTPGSFRRRLQ
ncbi:AraC family transcriptional regulator ligand-binding domain-containing protein [Hoeflea sp. Naph1]|uniref:AraC family transcriptional regulator n=1 Tax=Hoeflea sp. Naph1 TaxID=3388653 RepID=UPI00398FF514